MKCFLKHFIVLLVFIASQFARADISRIRFNNQNLFLSGGNVAWVNFARDIGPVATDFTAFENMFQDVHDNGGNCMRLWLHTNGASTPQFDGSGNVTGPGTNTISDLQQILDLAWEREVGLLLCLWSFDMLRPQWQNDPLRNKDMILNNTKLQTYIDNSLIPMVDALKGHPGIVAWEICNEPEGMTTEFGWTEERISMADVQKFVNKLTGAIHRTDPNVMVTNGSWSFLATTDVGSGNCNYYTDARLIAAGGDSDGYLDFYTVHYYDWAGTVRSPFHNDCSHWGLDKPLVVAEFWMEDTFGVAYADLYETLHSRGYAGSVAWQFYDGEPHRTRMLAAMQDMWDDHQADVDIILISGDAPTVSITWPVDGIRIPENVDLAIYADANDTDGSITKVEFFQDAIKLGEDTTSPYSFTWNNVPAGSYSLTAKATDNDNKSNTSTIVSITAGTGTGNSRYEAEDGVLVGCSISAVEPGYSGSGYVTGFDNTGDSVTVTVNVSSVGSYPLSIGYRIPSGFGDKINDIYVNGTFAGSPNFINTSGAWAEHDFGNVSLNAGDNTIRFEKDWGWMDVDYFELDVPTLCFDGDFNLDCSVDMGDVIILALGWLNPYTLDDFADVYIDWQN